MISAVTRDLPHQTEFDAV